MSSRVPRALALLLLAVVLLALLAAPVACLHTHDDGQPGDDSCALCLHAHSPVLAAPLPTTVMLTEVRRGQLLPAPIARQEQVALAVHAARGPPARG